MPDTRSTRTGTTVRGVVDPELAASWMRTEAHLREAASTLRGMSASANAYLAELLDHDELGLALDVLVESAVDLNATPQCWAALESVVAEMQLNESDEPNRDTVRIVRTHTRPGLG